MTSSHLKSLQAVESAIRFGALTREAEALSITPAAVGQRIKALEDYLGLELVVRGRSGCGRPRRCQTPCSVSIRQSETSNGSATFWMSRRANKSMSRHRRTSSSYGSRRASSGFDTLIPASSSASTAKETPPIGSAGWIAWSASARSRRTTAGSCCSGTSSYRSARPRTRFGFRSLRRSNDCRGLRYCISISIETMLLRSEGPNGSLRLGSGAQRRIEASGSPACRTASTRCCRTPD